MGQIITSLEYENLVTALNRALAEQVSIENLYFALARYLDATQDQHRGLDLGQTVIAHQDKYPSNKLSGSLGIEFASIIGDIGIRQTKLKQYAAAEISQQKTLELVNQLKHIDEKKRSSMRATSYHNLGMVAFEQRQWEQAEQYYQQALQIKIESNDRYSQASTYHNLGMVAEEQRQWEQAEQYYQQALQIYIEYKDRYAQADTYHQLGMVAQQQRQWEQAEAYYQQALQIYIEYKDRYAQASTYHQLGRVAEEQRQWQQAREYFLQALDTYVAYNDTHNGGIVLSSLARLWKASGDANLPAAVATILGYSVEETKKLLREMLEED